jgi:hypothetical protein
MNQEQFRKAFNKYHIEGRLYPVPDEKEYQDFLNALENPNLEKLYIHLKLEMDKLNSDKICCQDMALHVYRAEGIYKDDVDHLVQYNPVFDEYGLPVSDGGSSVVLITYCPWCGIKLPESKRDLWFEKLEELGYYDPFTQDIPEKFQSEKWYDAKEVK